MDSQRRRSLSLLGIIYSEQGVKAENVEIWSGGAEKVNILFSWVSAVTFTFFYAQICFSLVYRNKTQSQVKGQSTFDNPYSDYVKNTIADKISPNSLFCSYFETFDHNQ